MKQWFQKEGDLQVARWDHLRLEHEAEAEAEAEDAELMTGCSIMEASGDLYRSWFHWSCVHQSLFGICWERMGREEMVTASQRNSFENFIVKVYSEMGWLMPVSKVKDKPISFNLFYERQ